MPHNHRRPHDVITKRDIMALCRRIERRVMHLHSHLTFMENHMSQELDDLKREVQESKSVTEGATVLIQSLADQIRANKDDPAALEQLARDLDAQTKPLSDAVQANTIQPSGNT